MTKQGKFPIDRPCSACSAGDYKMAYHNHEEPFREVAAASLPESQPWHETETNILQVHAFFGGKLCWLKNGEIKCGMPYDNPIHELEVEPCDHSFVCEKCGEIHDSSPVPAAAPTSVQVTRIEEIAGDLAAAIYEVQQGTDEMAIKTLLLDFAKEIQRASIEPTGF